MEGQDTTPIERSSERAPADPQILARLLRIERRAARQGIREPSSEARLRAAVSGGEEHLSAHQDQAQARLHVKAVLEGAEPFRRNPKKVPLDEAVDALTGALKEVKRAARALGELKDLAGKSAKAGPWVARLIKAAAVADGEVQAVLQRFRNPESEENLKEDKDFGGRKGGAAEGSDPAPRRAAKAPPPSVRSEPTPHAAPAAASAPASDEPPAAASAPAPDEPPHRSRSRPF